MLKIPTKIYIGPDKIPPLLLRKCALSLAKPVAFILRWSYLNSVVPDLWKHATIIPLYKGKGLDKASPTNYRPVALTSPIAKLAEKFIYDDLKPFLENKQCFPNFQHGFMNNKSVTSLLVELVDDLSLALDSKKCIDLIFFDFKAAFDTVDLGILLSKLAAAGIGGRCLQWLDNFLTHRFISVSVNNKVSGSVHMNLGVAQGSILGPIMFNFYVSDILSNYVLPPSLFVKQFADDLQAYSIYDTDNAQQAHLTFNSFIVHIHEWSKANLLNLSLDKVKIMHFGNNNPQIKYSIDNHQIESVDTARNLGLIMTRDLKWNTHISNKCSVALRKWYNIARTTEITDLEALTLLYKSLVRPILEFPSIIFNPITTTLVNLLERVQRRITRHILFKSKAVENIPYEKRLKLLKLDALEIRRNKLDVIYYSKIINGEVKIINEKIPKIMPHFRTRNPPKFAYRPFSRLMIRRQSFLLRAPKKIFLLSFQ